MNGHYADTVSLCPSCAAESPAYYEEKSAGIYLFIKYEQHGLFSEQVESDKQFFKAGFERHYKKSCAHLAIPITYQCDLNCRYCYSLSNTSYCLPEDRTESQIAELIKDFDGNITFIGGEPTLREDLPRLIKLTKDINPNRKVSIASNGQRLKDIDYVRTLQTGGLDFIFLSFNDVRFDGSKIIHQNKMAALKNCGELHMPVWLQRTVDDLSQLDSIIKPLEIYSKIIFKVTIRSAKPFGVNQPLRRIFVSDILRYFNKLDDFTYGGTPFNRYIRLQGKPVKVCAWVNDIESLRAIDSYYIISDDTRTTFHCGMKMDEILIASSNSRSAGIIKTYI